MQERDLLETFLPVIFPENTAMMPDEPSFVTAVSEALCRNQARLGIAEALSAHRWNPTVDSLAELTAETGRPFVFFIDNFQAFVKAVLEGRGARRAGMQGASFLLRLLARKEFLVVAGSLQRGPASAKAKDAPVWKRFDIRKLGGLKTLAEANKLLELRARLDRDDAALRRFRDAAGRVRGVFDLSQQNPRYLVLLYKLLRQDTFQGIQSDFSRILDGLSAVLDDELTRQIPASRLPVLRALCQLRGRGGKEEVAERCAPAGTDPDSQFLRQVGKDLSLLADSDFVEVAEGGRGKKTIYQTTPPLFQLCFEMRYLGKSYRVILLEIFDTFPVAREEVVSAYRSAISDVRAHPEVAVSRSEEVLLYSHMIESSSGGLSDLMELGREVARRGGYDAFAGPIEQIAEYLQNKGDSPRAVQARLIRAGARFEDAPASADAVEAEVDRIIAESIDSPVLEAHALRLKAAIRLEKKDPEAALGACCKARELLGSSTEGDRDRVVPWVWRTEGDALMVQKSYREAAECYQKAAELDRQLEDYRAESMDLRSLGAALGNAGDHESAGQRFQEALEAARRANDKRGELNALRLLSQALANQERRLDAARLLREAATVARELGDDEAEARAWLVAGAYFAKMSRPAESVGDCDCAIEVYARLVEQEGRAELANDLAMAYGNRGIAYAHLGRPADAVKDHDRAIAIRARLVEQEGRAELANDLAGAYNNRGNAYRAMGRLADAAKDDDRAIEVGQNAVSWARRVGHPTAELRALESVASACGRRGRYDECLQSSAKQESLARRLGAKDLVSGARQNQFLALIERAREHALEGRASRAATDAESAGDFRDAVSPSAMTRHVHDEALLPLLAKGKLQAAMALARSLREWAPDELSGYFDAFEAAVPYIESSATAPIGKLPPVERSIAYEIARQARGHRTVAEAAQLAERGEPDEALRTLDKLLAQSPDDLAALRAGVTVTLSHDRIEAAEHYARQAMAVSEEAPQDTGNWGLVLSEKGLAPQAEEALADAVRKGSPILRHYLALSALYEKSGRFGAAAETMKAALQLQLDSGDEALVRMNLAEFLTLTDRLEEAIEALAPIEVDKLSPKALTDMLFHRYLNSAIRGEASAARDTLRDFCGHLLEHGKSIRSSYDLAKLVSHAATHLSPETAAVVRRWADVAAGRTGVAEFVQLYGAEEQREECARRLDDERGLALARLRSDRVHSLADLAKATTREEGVGTALRTYASAYQSVAVRLQPLVRTVVLEGLESAEPAAASAAVEAAGQLFWRFEPEERRRALSGLLAIAGRAEAPLDLRDAALRVLGAVYFQLEPKDKAAVAAALRSVASEYAPSHLRDLLARIGPIKEGNR